MQSYIASLGSLWSTPMGRALSGQSVILRHKHSNSYGWDSGRYIWPILSRHSHPHTSFELTHFRGPPVFSPVFSLSFSLSLMAIEDCFHTAVLNLAVGSLPVICSLCSIVVGHLNLHKLTPHKHQTWQNVVHNPLSQSPIFWWGIPFLLLSGRAFCKLPIDQGLLWGLESLKTKLVINFSLSLFLNLRFPNNYQYKK